MSTNNRTLVLRNVLTRTTKLLAASVLAAALAACGGDLVSSDINNTTKFSSSEYGVGASPRVATSNIPKGGGRYQVGQPYRVAGRWFHPAEQPDYNETGTASWYGPNFHGRLTANGEVFDQYHLSAAHPTLPLPSYVRVTNLSNGREITVRVNDRGPFAHNRLIDLSRRSAEVLGFINDGTAQVRVQYLGPAPVEGDDTPFLMAAINMQGQSLPQLSAPQSRSVSGPGGLVGGFISLFSYAPELGHSTSEASNAIAALTAGSLNGTGQPADILVGEFSSIEILQTAALEFAAFGALDHKIVTRDGQEMHQLRLVHMKDGVLPSDIEHFKAELGL